MIRARRESPRPVRGRRAARMLAALLASGFAGGCFALHAGANGTRTALVPGGPSAVVRAPSHDFGTVEPGTTIRQRFEVVNVGEGPLELESVAPSCGCTAALVTDRTIHPWQTGVVEVSLDTIGLSGPQSKVVRVRTNDPRVAEIVFTLHGSVVADVTVSRPAVFLGHVAPGEIATEVVEVVVHRPEVAITGVATESGRLDVSAIPLDPPQQGMRLVLTLRANEEGRISDNVLVSTTSSRQPKLRIPVLASIERDGRHAISLPGPPRS